MTEAPRILPVTDDIDTGELFAAAARGELVVRMCECGRALHLPVSYCHACGGSSGSWQAVSGGATLHSWTTVTQQMHAGYPVPYTVVLVALDEHPQVHMFGLIDGTPDLIGDQPMQVWFETFDDGTVIPNWRAV